MAGYGTDEGFAAWAAAAGHTVPAGTVAAARQRGSTYIDGAYGPRFAGTPTAGVDQEREWPRTGATDRFGTVLASTFIPQRVVHASYEAALQELREPGSLSVVGSTALRVKRERVDGAVEVEYHAPGSGSLAAEMTPVITTIEGLLAPLLRSSAGEPWPMVV